jgi:hypothetical protein
MALAVLGATVTLTDQKYCLPLLQHNVERNFKTRNNLGNSGGTDSASSASGASGASSDEKKRKLQAKIHIIQSGIDMQGTRIDQDQVQDTPMQGMVETPPQVRELLWGQLPGPDGSGSGSRSGSKSGSKSGSVPFDTCLIAPFDIVVATDILYSSQHDCFESLLETLAWACDGAPHTTEVIIVESVSFLKQREEFKVKAGIMFDIETVRWYIYI